MTQEGANENGTLIPSARVCNRIKQGCYGFLVLAERQSQAVELGQFADELAQNMVQAKVALIQLKDLAQ